MCFDRTVGATRLARRSHRSASSRRRCARRGASLALRIAQRSASAAAESRLAFRRHLWRLLLLLLL